jgi:Recombinase
VPFNPAAAVRGPKHIVRRGKTPVLTADQARELLDSIDTDTLIDLRDRALIGVMVYSFARVYAALGMKVADYYVEGRKPWFRLHECRNLDDDARRKGSQAAAAARQRQARDAYAHLIPTMLELQAAGRSLSQIAEDLNDQGHKTRRERRWSKTRVQPCSTGSGRHDPIHLGSINVGRK